MLTLNQGNGSFMPGVFVNPGTIIGAIDLSGKPTYLDLPESIYDLAVEVEFDIGKEWNKKVIFKGNLKYNPESPKVIDHWGSAFIVKDFFQKTGCFDKLDKNELKEKLQTFSEKEIPLDFISKIKGRRVYLVDYVKGMSDEGKLRYGTWNIVDIDEDKLKYAFKTSVAKGYPSNYKPELIESRRDIDSTRVNQSTLSVDFPF